MKTECSTDIKTTLELSNSASGHLHISAVKSKSLWPTLRVIILDAALQRGAKAKRASSSASERQMKGLHQAENKDQLGTGDAFT